MSGRRRTADFYSRKAKKEAYPARSIYKLEEIDRRVHLLRPRDEVVDLGAAPGSWTLYAAEKVGPDGLIVAIDTQPLRPGMPKNVSVMLANAMEVEPGSLLPLSRKAVFDVLISDMAPSTSGNRFVDQSRSFALFCRAVELARAVLRPGGRFVGKIFQGEDFGEAQRRVRELFGTEKVIRPRSVRSESYEVYIVGLDRLAP